MPNLSDFLLSLVWVVLLFFFMPMLQLARVITDATAGPYVKGSIRWKLVFGIALIFVFLTYLVLVRGMMQVAHDMTPAAEFPRQASGIGILMGFFLYVVLVGRSRKLRPK